MTKRNKKEIKCSICGSSDTTIRDFDDAISAKGEPIKEREIKCNECNERRTITL